MSTRVRSTGVSPIARAVAAALAAAAVVSVVLLAFAWPAVTSQARDLPVGIVGPDALVAQTTELLTAQTGTSILLTPETSRDTATAAIERREIYGAIVLGDGPTDMPEVLIATAANAQVAQMLQSIATNMQQIDVQLKAAAEAGDVDALDVEAEVRVTDIVPFADTDPHGAKLSTAVFPLVLGGVAGAVIISLTIGKASHRVVALGAYGIVGGLLLAAILQGVFGGLQGNYWINAFAIALSVASITAPIVGLRSLIGLPGIPVGAILTMLVANPISAATTPVEFMLAPWGVIGQWLPPGAGGTLLKDLSYFPGANTTFPWIVLAAWTTLGVTLTCVAAVRDRSGDQRSGTPTTPSLVSSAA